MTKDKLTVTKTSVMTTTMNVPTTTMATIITTATGAVPKRTAQDTPNPQSLFIPSDPEDSKLPKTPSEDDPRTSWIWSLCKENLQSEMVRYGLHTTGTVDELRRRFAKFWKLGIARDVSQAGDDTALQMDCAGSTLYTTELPRTEAGNQYSRSSYYPHTTHDSNMEINRIKEMLGLRPESTFNDICRTLSTHSRDYADNRAMPHGSPAFRLDVPTTHEGGVVYSTLHRPVTQTSVFESPCYRSVNANPTQQDSATLCSLVRKWNVRFDGNRDPLSFLERLEELMISYGINGYDILKALPELLYGTALLWYRNWRHTWTNYEAFKQSFELQFLPPGYRRNLDEEIRRRTQGERETFRSFVVALSTLMRRRGSLSLPEQLDIIYRNMKPDYKITMRRSELFSLEEMMRQAEHLESYWRDKALFRPPPSPSLSLVPETAYHPREKATRRGDQETPLRPKNVGSVISSEQEKRGHFEPNEDTEDTSPRSPDRQLRIDRPRSRHSPTAPKPAGNTSPTRSYGENTRRSLFICWNCDRRGHLFRECPQKRILKCFHCKQEGIRTRDCKCTQGNGKRTPAIGGHQSPSRK